MALEVRKKPQDVPGDLEPTALGARCPCICPTCSPHMNLLQNNLQLK